MIVVATALCRRSTRFDRLRSLRRQSGVATDASQRTYVDSKLRAQDNSSEYEHDYEHEHEC
jgi:hypothetical protein